MIAIVGAGIFGLTAALELRARGHAVTVYDPGPIPHPLAESTDISKVVRMDYGADADYTALGEAALARWRAWPEFHETGVTFLARAPMQPGGFEHDSFAMLAGRGHPLERLDARAIAARFPAYREGALVDGYFNPRGGWAASGAVVARLAAEARAAGVVIEERAITDELRADLVTADASSPQKPHDAGLVTADAPSPQKPHRADLTIVCAGAWVRTLVPELATSVRAIGQPVFHLRPADPSLFTADRFPVFGADIARTGYYGFPVTADGIVKIANHGAGTPIAHDDERIVTAAHEAHLRAFLAETFPALADAPLVATRMCVYGDTVDGHFWIARHPTRPNLAVATGGSGHAFKFAPVLGPLIADLALGVPHPLAHKFRWRPELAASTRGDAARARGE